MSHDTEHTGYRGAGAVVMGYSDQRWVLGPLQTSDAGFVQFVRVQAEGDAERVRDFAITIPLEVRGDELVVGAPTVAPA